MKIFKEKENYEKINSFFKDIWQFGLKIKCYYYERRRMSLVSRSPAIDNVVPRYYNENVLSKRECKNSSLKIKQNIGKKPK